MGDWSCGYIHGEDKRSNHPSFTIPIERFVYAYWCPTVFTSLYLARRNVRSILYYFPRATLCFPVCNLVHNLSRPQVMGQSLIQGLSRLQEMSEVKLAVSLCTQSQLPQSQTRFTSVIIYHEPR